MSYYYISFPGFCKGLVALETPAKTYLYSVVYGYDFSPFRNFDAYERAIYCN